MSSTTEYLSLIKPATTDFYNVADFNANADRIDGAIKNLNTSLGQLESYIQEDIDEVKDSVSDGKSAVASAITDKGVSTSSSATFATMAENIRAIETGASEGKEWSNPTGSDGSLIVDARTYRSVVYAKGMFYLFSDKSSYDQARFARLSPRDYDQVVYSGSVNAQNTDIYIDNVSGYDNQFKLYLIAYGNNVFVTQSGTDNTMYYSTDAKHWFSGQVLSVSLNTLSYIKECSKFIGVSGSYSDKAIYFSDDGINWTTVTTPEHSDSNIVYGNGKYVFFDGVIHYSEDLINWWQSVTIFNNESGYGSSLYYSESGIFVLSTKKSIYTSVDGVNWMFRHTKSHPFTSQKIVYGNGKYIIQGTTDNSAHIKNKYYLWSKDGITWEELEFPWMIYDIDYGSGVFCACGSDTSAESSQRGRIVISRTTNDY